MFKNHIKNPSIIKQQDRQTNQSSIPLLSLLNIYVSLYCFILLNCRCSSSFRLWLWRLRRWLWRSTWTKRIWKRYLLFDQFLVSSYFSYTFNFSKFSFLSKSVVLFIVEIGLPFIGVFHCDPKKWNLHPFKFWFICVEHYPSHRSQIHKIYVELFNFQHTHQEESKGDRIVNLGISLTKDSFNKL